MNIVFELNKLADEYESKAKWCRKIASDIHKPEVKKKYKRNGLHWTQKPENRKRVIKMAKQRAVLSRKT